MFKSDTTFGCANLARLHKQSISQGFAVKYAKLGQFDWIFV